jgi:adenylate cyclase
MSIALEKLASCFQGLIPATLYTCSKAGIPNVAYLSHVDYVDSEHVALSHQFFNKSRANIMENPQAFIRLYDPDTLQCYELRLRYVGSETSGPLFESMALRIEAIASHSGLKGIFKLIAADIYEVQSIEKAAAGIGSREPAVQTPRGAEALFTMKALQEISDRIRRSENLEDLLDSILAALDDIFGFDHSLILLAGEQEDKLVTIGSRGYAASGVGSEVGFGEGLIGMVAEARSPIRISGLLQDLLYAKAVRERAQEEGVCSRVQQIPLPGLPQPESQLGVPLLVRNELIGVLYIESDIPYRFHEEDKAYIDVLGNYLAIAIQNELLHERSADEVAEAVAPASAEFRKRSKKPDAVPRREICYYRGDECILLDGDYLIRGLPAKLLWKILSEYKSEGRIAFTNRLLRLDKSLRLPSYRDNLESRLLLLRRRLEQRCPDIRLVPTARGRFTLKIGCETALKEMP